MASLPSSNGWIPAFTFITLPISLPLALLILLFILKYIKIFLGIFVLFLILILILCISGSISHARGPIGKAEKIVKDYVENCGVSSYFYWDYPKIVEIMGKDQFLVQCSIRVRPTLKSVHFDIYLSKINGEWRFETSVDEKS